MEPAATSNKIKFYSTRGDYGCFSNFSNHRVSYKGHTYKTSEHAFQSMKFEGTKHEKEVRESSGPSEAARMGRDRKLPLRKDWESVKISIMYDIVYAKFTQNEDLKKTLLDTGDSVLIESTSNDSFWADGGDGSGKNMLGIILMQVREKIKSINSQTFKLTSECGIIQS